MNQLGGKPPNCPIELIPRANGLTIDSLIHRDFSHDYLIGFLGFDPGINFYFRLRGGMHKINETPVKDGIGTGLSFRHFLGVAKSSKTVRQVLCNERAVLSNPLDLYLNSKIQNVGFNSRDEIKKKTRFNL